MPLIRINATRECVPVSRNLWNKEGIPVKRSRAVSLAIVVALGMTLAGCCGGGGKTVVQDSAPTIETKSAGEQLMDLQKAHESGAINDKEYEKMRQAIIDKSEKK